VVRGVQVGHSTVSLGTYDADEFPEDRHVYERYFFGRAGGTFIESGALDGVRFSVTHALEKDLGWRGVRGESSCGARALRRRLRLGRARVTTRGLASAPA
jgi:hypothetical protein